VTITVDHGTDLIDPSSWKSLAVGHLSNPRVENGWTAADAVVSDGEVIQAILDERIKYVSAGYTAEVLPTDDPKIFTQAKIRYNHLALLPPGKSPRAGEGAQLRLDSAGDQVFSQENIMDPEQIKALLAEALGPINEKLADLAAKIEEKSAEPEADPAMTDEAEAPAEDPAAAEKARADSLEKALAAQEKAIPAQVEALIEAREFAKELGVPVAGKTLLQLRKDCASQVLGDLAGVTSEVEILAHFQAAKKISPRKDLMAALAPAKRSDSAEPSARDKFLAEQNKRGQR
jgi:hypothetical protein